MHPSQSFTALTLVCGPPWRMQLNMWPLIKKVWTPLPELLPEVSRKLLNTSHTEPIEHNVTNDLKNKSSVLI